MDHTWRKLSVHLKMDKPRNHTSAKSNVKHISLPTLVECGDGKMLEDWSSDRKIWLNLINVAEADKKQKSYSTLPNLTARCRSMEAANGDPNNNNVSEVSREKDIVCWEDDVDIADGEGPKTSHATDLDKENEKIEVIFLTNEEKKSGTYVEVNRSQVEYRKSTRSFSVGTAGIDRSGKDEKMASVRQWVHDQSVLDNDVSTVQSVSNDREKLPEMNIKCPRVRSVSEGSQSVQKKFDFNDFLGSRNESKDARRNATSPFEQSARLLETRQRKTGAAMTSGGLSLQTCDKDGMEVNKHECEPKLIPLIGADRSSVRKYSMAFPIAKPLRDQCLKDESNALQRRTIRTTNPATLLTSLDIPSRNSSVLSLSVLSCNGRGVTTNHTSLRKRPSTPRPPPLFVRSPQKDPLNVNLCP